MNCTQLTLFASLLATVALAADTKKSGGKKKGAGANNPAFANLSDISDTWPKHVPVADFTLPDDLEITVWATTPLLSNPTNMDTDAAGASTSRRP
jgi:hypothetical protein